MLPRVIIAALGGLALSAAFEPFALAWLLPAGVACFALATTGLAVRHSGLIGLCFGAAFMFTHLAWMRHSVPGPGAWVALAGLQSLFYGLLGLAVPLLRRLPYWPLWLAAAWTTMETLRSGWPLSGMPWGRLSYAVIDTPVAPAVAYLGITGLAFGLALVAFLLADLVERAVEDRTTPAIGRLLQPAAAAVGLLALLMTPAVFPYTVKDDGSAQVAVVQGNVPGRGDNILYDARGVTENHANATVKLADDVAAGEAPAPDFVLWPENSTATDPFETMSTRSEIERAVAAIGVPVLVGAIVDDGDKHVLNQGIVWNPATGPAERYTKHHPVPYGEYIPFRNIWEPKFGGMNQIRRDMRAGDSTEPLEIAGIEIADAICFDVAYDDVLPAQVRRGARLLTVQTSNASFIFSHQIEQQFAITRLRAIEAGRWLAVASPNGRTGVIDPDGTVVAGADIRSTAVLNVKVGLSSELTPAMRLGPWPARLLALATLLGLGLGTVAYRRGVISDPTDARAPEAEVAGD